MLNQHISCQLRVMDFRVFITGSNKGPICSLLPSRVHVYLCHRGAPWGRAGDKKKGRDSTLKKRQYPSRPCCATSPLSPDALLFLPLTSHCCNSGVSSEPCHRPLWRTLSSLTSACPSLMCNQRSSQMSRWDKWESFPPVMAPEMDWSAPLPSLTRSFSLLSLRNHTPFSSFVFFFLVDLFSYLKKKCYTNFLPAFFGSFVNDITQFLTVFCPC